MARWKDTTLRERFEEKVDRSGGPDACHEWTSTLHRLGYGRFYDGAKRIYAHREAWRLEHGDIPEGIHVLHRCDNRPCVNPRHLFLGTQKDNMADASEKGRMAKGVKNGRSKLTREQVKEIRRLRGKAYQKDLAKRFGVARNTICVIQLRQTWKHVE